MMSISLSVKIKAWLRFIAWPALAATIGTVVMVIGALIRDIGLMWEIVAGLWLSYWGVGMLAHGLMDRVGWR